MFIVVKKITEDDYEYCKDYPQYFITDYSYDLKSKSKLLISDSKYLIPTEIQYLLSINCKIIYTNSFSGLTNH